MQQNTKKQRRKSPDELARDFAGTQPAIQQAYAQFCFAQGYAAGHRARIEEAASLQAVEEEALAQVPEGPWRELIGQWLDYKRRIKKRYTLVSGIVGCYNDLVRESAGDIEVARSFVQRSINNGYIGIAFPNGHHTQPLPYPAASVAERRKEECRELSRAASASASLLAAVGFGDEEE